MNAGESFGDFSERVRAEQYAHDVTITHAHRVCLRRVRDGEPVGDLGHLLGALYLHDLIRDDGARITLTRDGATVLELPETRKTERPRLVSRPMPARWARHPDEAHIGLGTFDGLSDEDLAIAIRAARDLADLGEWVAHQRAVEAQQ